MSYRRFSSSCYTEHVSPTFSYPLLKGLCHKIFCFWFFSWISFPQAPEYTIRAVSNFLENSRRYSQLKVDHWYQRHRRQICHRCRWHRWQTMGIISGCRYLKVNLKAKMYICVTSTIQRCPNKIINIFLIEDFFICHRCRWHRWSTLICEYLREFFEKIRNGPNGILWGWGETDWWKKTRSKKTRDTVPLSYLSQKEWGRNERSPCHPSFLVVLGSQKLAKTKAASCRGKELMTLNDTPLVTIC